MGSLWTTVGKWITWKGTRWVLGSLALLVAAGVLYVATSDSAAGVSNAPPVNADDLSLGPAGAPVVLIEYSDFECGYCAGFSGMLKPLRTQYGDRVRFVFRFFPLANHEFGMLSAQAAYAAALQGKFWEMHDLLFENQQAWVESSDPRPYFDAMAEHLNLDLDRFHEDILAPSTIAFIQEQKEAGEAAGVSHTPWFIANDKVVIPRSTSDFERIFEEQREAE